MTSFTASFFRPLVLLGLFCVPALANSSPQKLAEPLARCYAALAAEALNRRVPVSVLEQTIEKACERERALTHQLVELDVLASESLRVNEDMSDWLLRRRGEEATRALARERRLEIERMLREEAIASYRAALRKLQVGDRAA